LRGFSPNFHIYVPVSDLYIPKIDPHISYSRIGRSIVGIYKSLTDTRMLRLGREIPFLGICVKLSVLVLCRTGANWMRIRIRFLELYLQCQQERKTFVIPGLADRVRRGVSGVRLGVIGRGRDLQQRLLLRSSLMPTISSRHLRYLFCIEGLKTRNHKIACSLITCCPILEKYRKFKKVPETFGSGNFFNYGQVFVFHISTKRRII
jgi:hypothetical protein